MGKVTDRICERFPQAVIASHSHRGDDTVVVARDSVLDMLRFLRDEPELDFNFLIDLTAVDYLEYPGKESAPRFEVVYHLLSHRYLHRIRLKVPVAEADCWAPTACELYLSANWLEREAWDLMGIDFRGHPNLKRLMMWEGFQGHPLRKDYPYNYEQPLIEPREPYKSMVGNDRGLNLRPRSLEVHGDSHREKAEG